MRHKSNNDRVIRYINMGLIYNGKNIVPIYSGRSCDFKIKDIPNNSLCNINLVTNIMNDSGFFWSGLHHCIIGGYLWIQNYMGSVTNYVHIYAGTEEVANYRVQLVGYSNGQPGYNKINIGYEFIHYCAVESGKTNVDINFKVQFHEDKDSAVVSSGLAIVNDSDHESKVTSFEMYGPLT